MVEFNLQMYFDESNNLIALVRFSETTQPTAVRLKYSDA